MRRPKAGYLDVEQFVVVATYGDHEIANSICEALEQESIPVMLQHIEIERKPSAVSAIRVLVPSHTIERSLLITERARQQTQPTAMVANSSLH